MLKNWQPLSLLINCIFHPWIAWYIHIYVHVCMCACACLLVLQIHHILAWTGCQTKQNPMWILRSGRNLQIQGMTAKSGNSWNRKSVDTLQLSSLCLGFYFTKSKKFLLFWLLLLSLISSHSSIEYSPNSLPKLYSQTTLLLFPHVYSLSVE